MLDKQNLEKIKDKLVSVLLKITDFLSSLGFITLRVIKKTTRHLVMLFKKSPSNLKKYFENIRYSSGIVCEKLKKAFSKKIRFRPKKNVRLSDTLLFFSGVLFAIIFLFLPYQVYGWYKKLPRPELLSQINNRATKILDRKGRVLYEIYVEKKYDPVPLERIPLRMIQATLAIEDDEFYSHHGVRPLSMLRAAKETLFESNLQGASTITQQLVKITLLTPERTVSRKVKEVFLSYLVEKQYAKDEILELYLNNIPYGGTAWGIQSASHKFFGKDVWDLSLSEISFLAGLPSAPSLYSPFSGGLENAKIRQKQVLARMTEMEYISRNQAEDAYNTELNFISQKEYIRAPHFVSFVRKELELRYGKRMVDVGGLTVRTTLDLDLQDAVQNIVSSEVQNNLYLDITNGAALILDVRKGEILAYVGSVDYFSPEYGAFDVITALRSPGSSIKPVTYSLALMNGYTVASVIKDTPFTIQSYNQIYSPKNYDGKFHGEVTLRQALANSYNVPAVKVLNSLGVDKMVELGKKMGIKTWKIDSSYGLSVTLGGKEVRLIDLANVYATLARGGVYRELTPIVSVKDANGFEIYGEVAKEKKIIEQEIAYIISDILSDNMARAQAFGYNSALFIPNHTVAVKTGTSEDKRDNLTVGFTPSFVAAVWVGNNDNSPMNPYLTSGLSGAAPIWNRIVNRLLEGFEDEPFTIPENIFVKIDADCGNKKEYFVKGTAPEHLCDLDKEDSKMTKNKKNSKEDWR